MQKKPWWLVWTPVQAAGFLLFAGSITGQVMDALKGKATLERGLINVSTALFLGVAFGLLVHWKRAQER